MPDRDTGVGGWLLVLCVYLALWQPINLAMAATGALTAMPVRGWPLAALLLAHLGSVAFGIGAAIAAFDRRPSALALLRAALVGSCATELFVYSTSIMPNNRVPGDTPLYLAWSLAIHGGWLLYLWRSVRVQRTLGG